MIKTSMKMVLAASLLLGGTALMAEQNKAPKMAKAPKLKPLTPEAEKAAYHLFDVLNLKKRISETLNQELALRMRMQPTMAPYEDIYRKFFAKYYQWDKMKKNLAKAYAQVFTPQEMKELAKFYSTKAGKKAFIIMPSLSRLSLKMAQAQIGAHSKELKAAVDAKAKALEAAAKKGK